MNRKVTKEEKQYLESRLSQLEEQVVQSTEALRNQGFKPAFCSGDGGFDDLPNYEMYANNARLRRYVSELRDTLSKVEVEEASTEKIGIGTKFVVTSNTLDGKIITKKYTLFGGVFMELNSDMEFVFVSVNSPFGKAVLDKKEKDTFSYVTPDKIVISGVIDEIVSEKILDECPKKLVKDDKKNTRN